MGCVFLVCVWVCEYLVWVCCEVCFSGCRRVGGEWDEGAVHDVEVWFMWVLSWAWVVGCDGVKIGE